MTLWKGRFGPGGGSEAIKFTSSFQFDRRFYREDIAASIAHAEMLGATGIISRDQSEALVSGLSRLRLQIDEQGFPDDADDEDIFTFVERRLGEMIGDPARALHTARSRNDQVATDFRLYLKGLCRRMALAVCGLDASIISLAARHPDAITAGLTHLQAAQPVLFAHQLMAYHEMLNRDLDLLDMAFDRADVLPLGAGALAGVPYPVDPQRVARSLNFGKIAANSMDAVSDRDFVLDFLYAATSTAIHLSRMAEDVCVMNSQPFAAINISDSYSTGSSIMPQKKNPDVAELARGKSGRIIGRFAGLLATMKGLPLTYNLDMQEDKEAVFDVEDNILPSISALDGLFATLEIDEERMLQLASMGNSSATDLADYLVGKGVSFREAHAVVGRIVRECVDRGADLSTLGLEDLERHSGAFGPDVIERLEPAWSVRARTSPGGTAPRNVASAIAAGQARVESVRETWEARGLPLDNHDSHSGD